MHYFAPPRTWLVTTCLAASFVGTCLRLAAQTEALPTPAATSVVLLEIENSVEVLRAGARVWDPGRTNQVLYPGDQVRIRERSRAVLRLSNLTLMRVGELSTLQIPDPGAGRRVRLHIFRGIYYFFHRDQPGEFQIRTPTVSAVVRGTEFNLEVAGDEKTVLALIDGEVTATNEFGTVELKSGESAVTEAGTRPIKTAAINAVNVIQWCLYYPAVLDLGELFLVADERSILEESLAAYKQGDLLQAVARYPSVRTPTSDAEKVYLAALLLGVGQVGRAEELIESIPASDSRRANEDVSPLLGAGIKELVAAVKFQTVTTHAKPQLATEWLAESYYLQSQIKLEAALGAALKATEKSPDFGFAWARVAELQFSFGRIGEATKALERSLELMPDNAQARALKGFLSVAQNRLSDAISSFDDAIAIDGALGNAWLGRGLCLIQHGKVRRGLDDLQVAATLEPQRALLRSYLAKGFSEAWDNGRATREVELAKRFDPADPTSWLYSALIDQQENRINEGVRDLERSKELNSNRALYRSRLLLDQDRAVRNANLAAVYRDAGMTELSLREASRAVSADYANYSAHLFLANSYEVIRDPRLIDLRFETAAVSEYLIANLLAPAGAGTLSRTISQQEYSRLFERDRLHVLSSTEYFSNGDWIQSGALYGKSGNTGFAVEGAYRSENGQRPDDDLEQLNVSVALKEQLTPKDSFYLQAIYFDSESGDLTRYYDPASANTVMRVTETQDPIVLAGYRHEWSPTLHTVLLASRMVDTYQVNNPLQPVLLLGRNPSNQVVLIAKPSLPTAPLEYSSESEIYSAEAQQIWQIERQSVVLGIRYQTGTFDTESRLGASTPTSMGDETMTLPVQFSTSALQQNPSSGFNRFSAYGYYNWQLFEPVVLSAGLAYDRLHFPENFRTAPLSDRENRNDQVSPKAGLIWTPTTKTTVRGSYTRSLGGVSIDQSFRLEPTEVGGFNQAFRSIIPESVAGANANASFETAAAGVDQRFNSGTDLGLVGELLFSDIDRTIGTFDLATTFPFQISPSGTRQQLDYRERTLYANANQLLSDEWSMGVRYRLSDAKLDSRFREISATVSRGAGVTQEATLHQVNLFVLFNHPAGAFARADALWTHQDNRGYSPDLSGDDFWHFNALIGWRFAQRRAEVAVGVLNIGDQDYRLNPLNLSPEPMRQRTWTVSMKLAF